jgi:hypothetical protein
MRNISRRLDRLEEHFGLIGRGRPAVESRETQQLRMRLAAAHLRCGSPPISPERQAELKGMSIVEILDSARRLQCELETTAPTSDEVVTHLRPSPKSVRNGP